MFVSSHSVVSVLTLVVLSIVFYFDPTQSLETVTAYNSCEECINSTCHKEKKPCGYGSGGNVLCFKCDKKTLDDDAQFFTKSDCEKSCADKSKCKCDGACWVCVEKGNPTMMTCAELITVFDNNCKEVPYVAK